MSITDRYIFYCNLTNFFKTLRTRMHAYLQEFQLLSKHQYGYRPRCTTAFAAESIHSIVFNNSDNGLYTCSIFTDLSKASCYRYFQNST